MAAANRAKLWSDFDGTAVEVLNSKNPMHWRRNVLKTSLKGVPGYGHFLEGVESTGVEIAGIVSRRPELKQRRRTTMRSISKLGLDQFFEVPGKIVLTGSEEAKGQFVAEQSRGGVVGMLEDKPHKLGAVLLGALREPHTYPDIVHHPLLLGVVDHGKSEEYMRRLVEQARVIANIECETFKTHAVRFSETNGGGFNITSAVLDLHVVRLEPYSTEAGQAFGQQLLDLAA